MKELIKKWLGLDDESLKEYVDIQIQFKVGKRYSQLQRSDKERYKELRRRIELLEVNKTYE
jgi:hypothetical protein